MNVPSDGEQMMTKLEILYSQSKSMATMVSHFASTFEIQFVFFGEQSEN
jgi:hypothetical protein